QASVRDSVSCWEKARISLRSRVKRVGGKNRLMKAVCSSSRTLRDPLLSSYNHVCASLVSDRGNIVRRTASFLVVTFNGEFIYGFWNGDYRTRSQSDNTVGSPHGFIIYGIEIFKGNEKVSKVINVENWRIDNSRVLMWIVYLIEGNSPVSSMKSSIQNQIDLINLEGNRVVLDISKPLPLGGPPGQIVLRIADYKEYKISKANFKIMHPNDFKDMYPLHLQGKLNHLSGADKVHLFNVINLWIRNIIIRQRVDAIGFILKEDYTIVHEPRAVIYRDRNNQKKMIRETEVHKFSDGTLTRIMEKLDFMVKDFELFKFNLGMENRI
nr:hypothetical protein [Tanacetum cinerariifolium]